MEARISEIFLYKEYGKWFFFIKNTNLKKKKKKKNSGVWERKGWGCGLGK